MRASSRRLLLSERAVSASSKRFVAPEDEDRRSAMRSPSLPNRTGGSPASGFPVSGCSSEEEHAFRAVPKDARQTFGSTHANCTRLVPPPVSPRGHSRGFVFRHSVLHPSPFLRSLRATVVTRFSATTDALTPAVAALRPARGMNTVFGPPPVSLIISLGLPAIPSPTINARPASSGCSAIRLGGLSPCRRLRPSLEGSPRRADRIEFTVSSCQGGRLLRTGRSRSIALHLALPRRSYGSIPHGSPPRGSGLPPLQPSAFSGALGTSRRDVPARVSAGGTNRARRANRAHVAPRCAARTEQRAIPTYRTAATPH